MNIGAVIDKYHELREDKRLLEAQLELLKKQMSEVEQELMQRMEVEGISKSTGKTATVSVSESVVPTVLDWNEFYNFIHKNNYFHLLERRPSVTGCRELFETKGQIPGVAPYVKKKLHMLSL